MNATALHDKSALVAVPVRNRYTNEIQFTAQVDCAPDATISFKLGLAVNWAVKNSANLSSADLSSANLSSANLSSADLSSANLSFADLSSANLRLADLSSASIRDEKVSRIVAIVERLNDPYTFVGFELESGGLKIMAGCRWFSIPEFCAHVGDTYPDTAKASETLHILDFIEDRARACGVNLGSEVAA